ncbi:MAG TPA: 3-dehydroquinate synthase [Candidatus Omnitrophota bacterium]|nr:3-dehydroquinate synthase [Candidatus Omnitrophota bacterium]HPS20840.1 3-dehydroquinate synthase [Candidatus Omnitrophota bacterium]
MKKIRVDLKTREYDIFVGHGVVSELPCLLKNAGGKGPVIVVTDTNIFPRFGKTLGSLLKRNGFEYHFITVPASERSKSPETYYGVIKNVIANTRMSYPVVVAFGGGVVGDLAGFVAATYRRGVPFIQVPTTLLAQVDSSIGGKVGIDLPEAKNIIGAFYQPEAVVSDTEFLSYLPARQLRNGFAEVVKYAVIWDSAFFAFLETNIRKIFLGDRTVLEKVVFECARIKARVVAADERDNKGQRVILNFGHTLGHAIESAAGYGGSYCHGEAIAVGMLMACDIAVRLDMMPGRDLLRIKELIRRSGLPTAIKGVPFDMLLKTYVNDKKFVSGTNRFVLPKSIGRVDVVEDIPEILIKNVIKDHTDRR